VGVTALRSSAPKGAQTVLRALEILEAFDDRSATLSLSNVARKVHLTVPTTHRLLRALASRDFVVFDEDARRFAIGPAIVRLAASALRRDDLIPVAVPALERLVELTGESVGVHYRTGMRRVCLFELDSPQPIRMTSGIGHAYPLYAGAPGKAMLAWSSDKTVVEATASLRRITPRTPRDANKLRAELVQIRKVGYAMSIGETVTGAAALAAPILDHNGEALAAINISGPSSRWTREKMLRVAPALLRETRLVTRRLGHDDSSIRANGTRPR